MAKSGSGKYDAVEVIDLRGLSGALDRDQFESANFRDDEDEAGQGIGSDSSLPAVSLPVIFSRQLSELRIQLNPLRATDLSGLVIAMKKRERVGDARDEGPNRKSISTDVEAVLVRARKVFCNAVSLVISDSELPNRNLKPDVAEILQRGCTVMRDLIDVERELDLDVLVAALGVVH